MLYATAIEEGYMSGHVDDVSLRSMLNLRYKEIEEIQADGHELERCCEILGRKLPSNTVYTFLGNNAKEIARNWN